MTPFADIIQQGAGHAWLFVPSAILLGALHGLEPGHSKTMMAAFIIAVQGTVSQAVLLGLSATLSHTAVVWVVALAGQYAGQEWGGEATEPYFQLASAVIIVAVAVWMLWRTWREQHAGHGDHHHHHHGDDVRSIATGSGLLLFEVFEDGVPPRWRIRAEGALPPAQDISVDIMRPDGNRQSFGFAAGQGCLESVDEIPEPHAFTASLRLRHGETVEVHDEVFEEHDHQHLNLGEEDDAHAREHAADIRRRFSGGKATTGQIVMFGLTGGLIPCPAAITVLLLCIQLKQISLGVVLVLCFSIGLALTMVSAGVLAALSVKHVATRWSGFGTFARRAPYASGGLIILVGLYMGVQGWNGIRHSRAATPAITTSARAI
ncbi:nickel/cobalt efflux transporter [Rhodopseudomonas sp. RCAM05734]|uniref:nickel/cobalt efflux transporter n=1 Tax=Rhodopseudomonas sp. RCAM05734 TaxID=3457549 RepID=UPI0040442500